MKNYLMCVIYLCLGVVFSFITLQQILTAVWGVPNHPLQYVAFFSGILLIIASLIYLKSPVVGRVMAVMAVIGMGFMYVPASASLVPSYSTTISIWAWVLIAGYFGLLLIVLFYPNPYFFSKGVFILAVLISIACAGYAYYQRLSDGEYSRPEILYYEWENGDQKLEIKNESNVSFSEDLKKELESKMTGEIKGRGSFGKESQKNKLIIICKGTIKEPKQLFYPRNGSIAYVFDGQRWLTTPENQTTYSSYTTLEVDGFLSQKVQGGIQSYRIVP
ncbi:MAG: hypothetical protein V4507_05915 [Verrucomicrobiota bacterium]